MNYTEILSFVVPDFHDSIQAAFFLLIFGLAMISIVSAMCVARPARWERKWINETPNNASDDLDAEHGSIHDLSNAIATNAEKLVEILPGILLVIGLLGTFIGLGIALNKASAALSGAADINQMDSAMQNLMSMLQGLGIKFKASTWGITGFLLMKVLSSCFSFDDKRLRWCIRKVKGQLDDRRHDEAKKREAENLCLINAIKGIGTELCQTFESHIAHSTNAMTRAFSEFSNENKMGLKEINSVISLSIKENADNLSAMQNVVADMGGAVGVLSSASEELKGVIGQLDEGISNSLEKIKNDLGSAIIDMSSNIGKATQDISFVVGNFSKGIGETMNGVKDLMQKSDKRQTQAQSAILTATDFLGESAGVMKNNLEKIGGEINSGLKAISTGNQKVGHMMGKFDEVAMTIKETSESGNKRLDGLISALEKLSGGWLFNKKNKPKKGNAVLRQSGSSL